MVEGDLKRNFVFKIRMCVEFLSHKLLIFFQQSLRLVSTRKSVYFTSCCVRSRRRRVIRFATVVFLQNNPRKAPCRGIVKLVPLAHRWGPVKTVPTATAVVSLTTTTSCSTRPEFIQTTPK